MNHRRIYVPHIRVTLLKGLSILMILTVVLSLTIGCQEIINGNASDQSWISESSAKSYQTAQEFPITLEDIRSDFPLMETSQICDSLPGENFFAVLTVYLSDTFVEALERARSGPTQLFLKDENGNAVFQDYQLVIYSETGEKIAAVDKDIFPTSLCQPLLSLTYDGNIAVFSTEVDPLTYDVSNSCTVFDKEGQRISTSRNLDFSGYKSTPKDFVIDGLNNILVLCEDQHESTSIYSFSPSGELLGVCDLGYCFGQYVSPTYDGMSIAMITIADDGLTRNSIVRVNSTNLINDDICALPNSPDSYFYFFLRDDDFFSWQRELVFPICTHNGGNNTSHKKPGIAYFVSCQILYLRKQNDSCDRIG